MTPEGGELIFFSPFFFLIEVRTILNIPISYNLTKDKIIWAGNNKGVFIIKSAYYVALNMWTHLRKEKALAGIQETVYGRRFGT